MTDAVGLLDVVALTTDIPADNLARGEMGTVVEGYPGNACEVEFVAQDGYTYALVTLRRDQLLPLRQKRGHADPMAVPAALEARRSL